MARAKVDKPVGTNNQKASEGAKQRTQPKRGAAKDGLQSQAKLQQTSKSTSKKRRRNEKEEPGLEEAEDATEPPSSKRAKEDDARAPEELDKSSSSTKTKTYRLLSAYGKLLLQDLNLPEPNSPTPSNLLALVFNAMLTSARISHQLANQSVVCLIEAGYHDVDVLQKSSWDERTEVLTKGGYTHYREKTSTALGELADFVKNKYDGDLNNLLKKSNSSPTQIRKSLQEIKGIGNVGTDIFFDTAQGVWPCIAPFIDPRSLKTAERIGLGNSVNKIWQDLGEDPVAMCKLSSALTTIRLEKKEKEFE